LFCFAPNHNVCIPIQSHLIMFPDIIIGDRFIPIVDEFTYLGSVISRDCSDEADVNRRILKARNAFGMIRKCLFSSEREREMNLPLAQGIGPDTWTGFTAL